MITKKDTGYNNDLSIPLWVGYRRIVFPTPKELLQWINNNTDTLELSEMIFMATLECFEKDIDAIIVVTLTAEDVADIDVIAKKDSYNSVIDIYFTKLLELEQYEKLAEIKTLTESIGLNFPKN